MSEDSMVNCRDCVYLESCSISDEVGTYDRWFCRIDPAQKMVTPADCCGRGVRHDEPEESLQEVKNEILITIKLDQEAYFDTMEKLGKLLSLLEKIRLVKNLLTNCSD